MAARGCRGDDAAVQGALGRGGGDPVGPGPLDRETAGARRDAGLGRGSRWGDRRIRELTAALGASGGRDRGHLVGCAARLPPSRPRGAPLETAAAHIVGHGARQLESTVRDDDPDARAFAKRLGFEEGRTEQYWELEVGSTVVAKAERADEVSVVRLREVRDRERELFELYDAAERDMPDDYTHAMAFEDWLPETLGNPELDLDLSAVVLVAGRPAAFAWLTADRGGACRQRDDGHGAGVSPARPRPAGEGGDDSLGGGAGVRTIVTSNDTTNADMLALNEHLGYRPSVLRISVTKEV